MAKRKVRLGSVGPFIFDDANFSGVQTDGVVEAGEFNKRSDDAQSEPSDPAAGNYIIWLSNGTGAGDDGDLMVKITDTGGNTKTATLVDFSSV